MVGGSQHTTARVSPRTRTSSQIVTFERPFSLSAIDGPQPPGSYTVETDEELIGSVSFPAYRRTATWLRLPFSAQHAGVPVGIDRVINIDRSELDAALARELGEIRSEAVDPLRATEAAALPSAAAASPVGMHGAAISTAPRTTRFSVQDWLDHNNSALTWIALASLGLLVLGFLMSFDFPGASRT
jgi:hypothetical protein